MAGWRHPAGEGWSAPGGGYPEEALEVYHAHRTRAPRAFIVSSALRKSRYPGTLFPHPAVRPLPPACAY